MRRSYDVLIAVLVLMIVMLIIIPLPTWLVDFLLTINIALSVVILLSTLYVKRTLEFSVFPSLLLITTMFRLAMSVSTTRLILGNNGFAGNIVQTFGSFVIGDEMVVGIIIFLMIIIINFIVITKGAERVSEVAARFTLDAMPGKQMAIDADLNAGMIDEQTARKRREEVQQEASFFGAMDGASKFVKGDAIVGFLVMFVNIIGGMVIGMVQGGMPLEEVFAKYTMATVGDGLVSSIPALMISTSMGIIVTRSGATDTLGNVFFDQLFSKPLVMFVTAGMITVMSLIPGMPTLSMLLLAGFFVFMGIAKNRAQRIQEVPEADDMAEAEAEEIRKPENVTTLLQIYPIEMEVGYSIIPLVDASQGGDLLDRLVMIRRQCALDMGIVVPVIRLRDNIQFGASEYAVKIKGVEVAHSEVMIDHFLALDPGGVSGTIQGIPTTDPTYGLPALWITEKDRERADLMGYTTIDTPSVIATHLTEIIKRHGHELLNRQQVQLLVDNIRQSQPALVDEVIPKMFSLGDLQRVLAGLLRENVPVRDLGTILETLGDYGTFTHDTELLVEYVRQNLRRTITRRFVPDNKARVITLDANLERMIAERIRQTEQGSYVAMEPENVQRILLELRGAIERLTGLGITPIVLTAPNIRRHFKRMVEPMVPDLMVLSYNELEPDVEIFSDGMVSISA